MRQNLSSKIILRYTHTICNDDFTYYFTTEDKKRLTIIRALQLIDRPEDQRFLYTERYTGKLLKKMNFPDKSISVIEGNIQPGKVYSLKELECAYESFHIDNKKLFQARLFDSMAVTYYHKQKEVPKAKRLITDNASEFYLLSGQHALCWIHDIRNYKKLSPVLKIHIDIYNTFMKQLWDFYATLKRFRKKPSEKSIGKINEKFDEIFSQKTGYSDLDYRISRTMEHKDKLLLVLKYPFLPLHNNQAELALRRIVRKRDISLHTMTRQGTRIRDAVLSVVETAQKLKLNCFNYIKAVISSDYSSLPELKPVC